MRVTHSQLSSSVFVCVVSITIIFITLPVISTNFGQQSISKENLAKVKTPERKATSQDRIPAALSAENILKFLRWNNNSACKNAIDFGSVIYRGSRISPPYDHRTVCFDRGLAPVHDNCLVYSFGVRNSWSFEQDMAEFGCHIFVFDYSSLDTRHSNQSEHIYFYNSLSDSRVYESAGKRGASSIDQMLKSKHGDKVIDVLKMDVEWGEWDSIYQMTRSGFLVEKVKQLMIEIHFDEEDSLNSFQSLDNVIKTLESISSSVNAGRFVRFVSRPKPCLNEKCILINGKKDYRSHQLAWYNSRFLLSVME